MSGAIGVTDLFLRSFNEKDAEAHARTLSYPHVRLASGTVRIWQTLDDGVAAMRAAIPALVEAGWDHSVWDHRDIIHVREDKVHLDVQFSRFRADGTLIGEFPAVYVIVITDEGWRIQCRSSFAP